MAGANLGLYTLFVLIGVLAGWVAGGITKSDAFGRPVDLVMGAIGAMIGGGVFLQLAIATIGWFLPMICALGSAAALLALLRVLKILVRKS